MCITNTIYIHFYYITTTLKDLDNCLGNTIIYYYNEITGNFILNKI